MNNTDDRERDPKNKDIKIHRIRYIHRKCVGRKKERELKVEDLTLSVSQNICLSIR